MDLVNPTHSSLFKEGLVGEEFPQEDGATRALDPGEACDTPSGGQGKGLGFEENSSRLAIGKRWRRLVDP
jgi:hypothetical protein